ncbi:unnamed protein product [Urochloa decumbens]|uniref:KIB1-4 beta-propeller domain-containing protein n=1 Tax=Urochloa decumbens TaxID=240449 RepID=A0ABC9AU53_9POAL
MGSSEQRRSSTTTADFIGDDTAAGVFDEKTTQEGPTPGACREPPPASPLWAAILADILGVVLRFLPCLTDRAAVRSVCRHWRAAARGPTLPPPLPLLVISGAGFRFSSFTAGGALMAMAAWPFRMPQEVAEDRAHCVGSIEGWLLVARPTTSSQSCEDEDAGNKRFLMNAFSRDSIRLPGLRTPYYSTSGEATWISDDRDNGMSRSLEHVVISAPPDSGTKCIVAGFSYRRTMPGLAEWRYLPGLTLWQSGMKEWYVYQCDSIDWLSDLVFCQGKLYMLHRTNPWLFAVTLGEDEHGVC